MNKQIIKAIEALIELEIIENEPRFEMARALAISILEQQLTNGWIPCKERLPSFNDVCDITRNGVVIEDVIYQGINDGEDTWLVHSSSGDYKYIPVYSAIAWRNHIIPEPYKEVSE